MDHTAFSVRIVTRRDVSAHFSESYMDSAGFEIFEKRYCPNKKKLLQRRFFSATM